MGRVQPVNTLEERRRFDRGSVGLAAAIRVLTLVAIATSAGIAHADDALPTSPRFFGTVTSGADGRPVAGALVTFVRARAGHFTSVYTDEAGRYVSPPLATDEAYVIRVRRIGWDDRSVGDRRVDGATRIDIVLTETRSRDGIAAQLPANVWYDLVLSRIDDPAERKELKQQCTYCHQQGNWATRRPRTRDEWEKLIRLMGTRGAMISRSLREKLPDILIDAYDHERAVAALVPADFARHEYAPLHPAARSAVIEEWPLGGRASTQHDVMVHPDGRLYSVDGPQDQLHRLDISGVTPARETWTIPHGDLPLGGVFATSSREEAAANAYVKPHSLQTAPDGSIWITLASGNQLARFDVETETFEIHEVDTGIYPHTLRFDPKGRIWYTMAATNHVGMFDPETKEQRHVRLPARSFTQGLILRMTPFFLKIGRVIDIRGAAADGDGIKMPVPYGIDIAPDGGVWFSQLNEHKIGRIDPESFETEMIATPFETPRRLRFDARGGLWIPSFSEGLLAHFDPATRAFRTWPIPIEPQATETPYALAVEPETGAVWICGTNSDTMIRFEPEAERFTVYPLPTRVTYTREVDFDAEGRVWTSNSNAPTWQVERGVPNVVRIDPDGVPVPASSGLFPEETGVAGRVR